MYFFTKNQLNDSQQAPNNFGIQELPLEVVNHIFTFLPLLDLHALQKISWYFTIQIKASSPWKKKVQAHFNLTPPIEYTSTPLSVYIEWLIKQHNEDSFKSMCEYIFNPVYNPHSYVTHNYAVSLSRDILRKKPLEEIKSATTSYHLKILNSCSEIMQENLFNARLKICLIEIAILTGQTEVVYHLITAMDLLDIKALSKLLLFAIEKKQLQTAAALSELLLNVFASSIKEKNVSRQAVADYAISHFLTFSSLSQAECAGVLSILCCETYPNSRPSSESIEKVLVWLSEITDISVGDRVNLWQKITLINEPFENINRQCVSIMLKFAAEVGNLFLVSFFYNLSGKNRAALSGIDAALTIATHKQHWPIVELLCSNPKKSNRPSIQCVNQLLLANALPLMDGGILLQYLCTQGASPNTETINKAIKSAAQLGRLESVKYFKNWLIKKQRELIIFDELDKQSVAYALPENIKNWIHNGKRAVDFKCNLKTDASPLANVVLVLEGYTKVNFWNRLGAGAWQRHHIPRVKRIIDAIKADEITTREQLFHQLSEIMSLNNFNKKGELAKRIQIIDEQIEWELPSKNSQFSPTPFT